VLLLALLLSGCGDVLTSPAATDMPVALSLSLHQGGQGSAFDRADRVAVRLSQGETRLLDTTVPFTPTAEDARIAVRADLQRTRGPVRLDVEVRRGSDALYRGATQFAPDAGEPVVVSITPVIARVRIAAIPLTAVNQRAQLQASIEFATGDPIPGATAVWTSLDPQVLAVTPQGMATVLRAGQARVRATAEGVSDERTVQVSQTIVVVTVSPSSRTLAPGASQTFTATAVDVSGNPVTGRTPVWTSSNNAAVTIDANGVARALAAGSATITADIGGVTGSASVIVQAVVVQPPNAPRNLIASLSGNVVMLNWTDAATDESRVEVWRGSGGGARALLATLPVNANTYRDSATSPNTVHDYAVRACNSAQCSDFSGGVTVYTIPAAPAGLTVVLLDSVTRTIELRWQDRSGYEGGFSIERRIDSGGWVNVGQATANATRTQLTGVIGTNTHRVRACNGAGCSDPSNEAAIVFVAPPVVPRAPTGLTATVIDAAARTVLLDWQDNSTDETAFVIERRVGTGSYAEVGRVAANVTRLLLTGVLGTNTHRVRACNTAGCSLPSNEASITFTAPPPLPSVRTEKSVYNTELNGTVDGNGSSYEVWFEWGYSPDPNIATPVRKGTDVRLWTEALTGLVPHAIVYYRIVARNASGTVRGAILSFITPQMSGVILADKVVCNSEPGAAGVPACPINRNSTTIGAYVQGPSGIFQSPFTRVYVVAYRAGAAPMVLGNATMTATDNGFTRTYTYLYTWSPNYKDFPAGSVRLEVLAETRSGGSILVLQQTVTVTVD
jgi:hypothetical protein